MISVPNTSRRPRQFRSLIQRWLLKTFIFSVVTLVVLNPNLKRAFLQVRHTFAPESLIQTSFAALPGINQQLDRWIRVDRGRHSEARLVAKFVLKNIRYVSDYENWDNLEYWPTAEEVWAKRQEDCDGRAILATSLLRSRGFHSARMIVGLDHMWIRVDENEKDPSKPAHVIALLSPNPKFSLELHEHSQFQDFLLLAKALLHPAALRDTLIQLFAEIPPLRKAILVPFFLFLCYYPGGSPKGLMILVALGLGAVNLLRDWQPGQGHLIEAIVAGALLSLAVSGALFMNTFLRRQSSAIPTPSAAQPVV